MDNIKTKTIKNIENKMSEVDSSSIRYKVLENAKDFKTSWIDLGSMLYVVWRDKLFKEWGYKEFENYLKKEIGIRKETALKLLRSYSFLEEKEPDYLDKKYNNELSARDVPSYEAVDVLRKANDKKDKGLGEEGYKEIRKYVLEEAADPASAKKELTKIMEERCPKNEEENIEERKTVLTSKILTMLKTLTKEAEIKELLPDKMVEEIQSIIKKIDVLLKEHQNK
ncbi:hypothetical protein OMAG_001194 [Candidatus Omnitrophus magneticus]|uniref:Uncharacterized protein n=1 Tax=Candidatus Omnitrophus magneticus TaxID=1609969 RepID=A0A0F0CSH2_9BACT|nr:hypothetical protein OMAG_001194 [Candidatus Omnitrophus magneticus]